jgi:hypothetical protein
MRRLQRLAGFWPLLLLIVAVSPVVPVIAQNTCPALVEQALIQVDDDCASLDRNSACYGYNLVSASFTEPVEENFFTAPSDRTAIRIVESIGTAAMAVEEDVWGVALLNLQANIPNTIPGQSVRFVLLGNMEIENAVEPQNAYQPVDPVDATTLDRLNIRSGPSTTNNVIDVAAGDTPLAVDGLSADGDWVRVVTEDAIGWAAREFVGGDLDDLPRFDDDTRMPMQAFYLRTGIGEPACEEAPEAVLIQGPDRIAIDLTINGADVRLASTMIARIIDAPAPDDVDGPEDVAIEFISVSGVLEVEGTTFLPGESGIYCLSPEDSFGIDGRDNDRVVVCPEPETRQLSVEEQTVFCPLAALEAPNTLNYTLPISCEDGFVAREDTPAPVVDIVPSVPDAAVPGTPVCDGFVITSPNGGVITEGTSQIYWDGVSFTDSYLINASGATFPNAPGQTNGFVQGLQLGTTVDLQVDALEDGQVVCSTPPVTVTVIGAPPPQDPPTPDPTLPLNADAFCSSDYQLRVTWNNIPASETVTINFTDVIGNTYTATDSGASSGETFSVSGAVLGDVTLTSSDGRTETINLGGLDCKPALTANAVCAGDFLLRLTWGDLAPTDTLSISFSDGNNTPYTLSGTGQNGILTQLISSGNLSTDVTFTASPSGETVVIPGGFNCDPPPFNADWSCTSSNYQVQINYFNATPGDGIDASVDDGMLNLGSTTAVNPSGSFIINNVFGEITSVVVENTDSGETITLTDPGTYCKPISIRIVTYDCLAGGGVQIQFADALPGVLIEGLVRRDSDGVSLSATTTASAAGTGTIFLTAIGTDDFDQVKVATLGGPVEEAVIDLSPVESCP